MADAHTPETRYWRNRWPVTVHRCAEGFYAVCLCPDGTTATTDVLPNRGSAWQQGYQQIARAIQVQREQLYRAIAEPLTLVLLYVSAQKDCIRDLLFVTY
ncbi:MAG TPA: hypothetical protein DCQ32_05955 [Cyanobacteria bacterium UBA8156]|jgi:hypothetical protein|nr:hypothetical protein [Cyanobacteria bacterium UBA8156]